MEERNLRKTRVGKVVSNKMDKTIVVAIEDHVQHPLYKKIKSIVETILNDFVDDVSLFEHLLEDFTAFGSKEKRRAQLIEQRTKDAEEGLAV